MHVVRNVRFIFCQAGGEGGGNAWDPETMLSQLTKRSSSQRVLERAGKVFAPNSPASAAHAMLNNKLNSEFPKTHMRASG